MLSVFKRWAGPGITFLTGLGFQLAGVENVWVGYGFWIVAACWAFFMLPPIKKRVPFFKSVEIIQKRIPCISVTPCAGRREWDWEHEHLMWAELRVKNISPSLTLKDVEVRVVNCVYVMPSQEISGSYVMVNSFPVWNPTGVYWSERDTAPSQFILSISPNGTKTALIAFQDNSNGITAIFNAPTYPRIVGGAKIGIEISSLDSAMWKGEFYIECHPNYVGGARATFEFVTWEVWIATHNLVE